MEPYVPSVLQLNTVLEATFHVPSVPLLATVVTIRHQTVLSVLITTNTMEMELAHLV